MSAREIISLLFRERIAVMIAFVIPILLAIGMYTMAKPSYQATAKLLLGTAGKQDNKSEVSNNAGQSGPFTTKQEVVNSELEILTSRDLARATIEDIGVSTLYPALADKGEAGMEVAVEGFSRALAVKPVKASDILEVGFDAASPALAQTVLSHLIERYQQKHIEVYSRSLSGFLDAQVAGFEHQLRQIENEIADLKAAKAVFQVSDERRQLLDSRTTIAQTISQLRSRSAELENRLVQLRRLKKDTPEALRLYSETEQSDALERARSQLLDLELQDTQLSARFSDNNRAVQNVRQQIGILKDYVVQQEKRFAGRVRTGRNPLFDEINAEIARAEAEVQPALVRAEALEQDVERIEERLRTLTEAERILVGLERERDSLETSLRIYRQRQADSRILEDLDRQKIVSISVIQLPQGG
ncbi:MAG: hypothetical protein JO021_04935, partial [Alphaproteobacteria bacterium]|nr:hypothetical protein [Alphaproteobacteria bacterium]